MPGGLPALLDAAQGGLGRPGVRHGQQALCLRGQRLLGGEVGPEPCVALGERVVVIGGGNVAIDVARTALRYAASDDAATLPAPAQELLHAWGYDNAFIDAARTALRLGARHVQLVSLESRAQMPAHANEVREAEEECISL